MHLAPEVAQAVTSHMLSIGLQLEDAHSPYMAYVVMCQHTVSANAIRGLSPDYGVKAHLETADQLGSIPADGVA